MKKAQTSEFIGIVILVTVLSLIVMFNKLGSDSARLGRTEEAVRGFKNIFLSTSVTKFPHITEKGVTLNELFGAYVCYGDIIVDYGDTVGEINIVDTVIRQLDNLYGRNMWRLELNEILCITSAGSTDAKCQRFTGKEYITYDFMFPLSCSVSMSKGKIYIINE